MRNWIHPVLVCLLLTSWVRAEEAKTIVPAPGQFIPRDVEEEKFLEIGFEQKLNTQLPLDLQFRDEEGEVVKLDGYFADGKPVVLALVYYECPMLCNLLLNGMATTMKELEFSAGDEYNVVTLSFDHEETHVLAKNKKAAHIADYARPGAEDGWHFLVGDEANVTTMTKACGFNFKYNPKTDEFSHRAGLLIVTPEGKISRYLPGTTFNKRHFRTALVEASENKIGTISDALFLLCYKYDPTTGKYSVLISNTLKVAGMTTVGLIGLCLFFLFKNDVSRQAAQQTKPPSEQG